MLDNSNQTLFKILDKTLFRGLPLILLIIGATIVFYWGDGIYKTLTFLDQPIRAIFMAFLVVSIIFTPVSIAFNIRQILDNTLYREEEEAKQVVENQREQKRSACNLYIKTSKR